MRIEQYDWTTDMVKAIFIGSALWLGLLSGASEAATLGSSSSESMTISVTIPPLGPAVEAAQEGAQGLWSIAANDGGMMIKAPDEFSPGEAPAITLFAAHVSTLRVMSFGGVSTVNAAHSSASNRDFQNQTFRLPATNIPTIPLENAAVFTIGTI